MSLDARFLSCKGQVEIEENLDRLIALVGVSINGTAATDNLAIPTNPTANDTMTIGTKVYTLKAVAALDGDIAIGAANTDTQLLIRAAINGTGAGQVCTAHPLVTCGEFAANSAAITARVKGIVGNSITTTETFTAVGNVFSAVALAGGLDGAGV